MARLQQLVIQALGVLGPQLLAVWGGLPGGMCLPTILRKEFEMNDNQSTKCTCTGPLCSCGAHGIVKDGSGVRVPASMMDNAGNTDGFKVGMTIDQAAALPRYDAFRGLTNDNGLPMERERAMIDLANAGAEGQRAEATRDQMVDDLTGRHGVSDVEGARAKMLSDMQAGKV